MQNFGIFTARPGRAENGENARFTYYDNAAGIEWDAFFAKPENKANWYLAIDAASGAICCCDQDYLNVRGGGYLIIGLDSIAPWTNNEGGTIYGCRIDLASGAILPPPLPDITKRQIKLWLLKTGKNPKKYPAEVIAKIADDKLQMQAEIEWVDGDSYSRESDFVKALAASLNWSAEELDAAWREIAAID